MRLTTLPIDTSKNSENRNLSFAMSGCSNIVPIHLLVISSARSSGVSSGRRSVLATCRSTVSTMSEALLGSGSRSPCFSALSHRCGKLVTIVSIHGSCLRTTRRKQKYVPLSRIQSQSWSTIKMSVSSPGQVLSKWRVIT